MTQSYLKNIVTMGETWVYPFDPEQKKNILHTMEVSSSLSPKKVKMTSPSGKVIFVPGIVKLLPEKWRNHRKRLLLGCADIFVVRIANKITWKTQ